MPKMRTDKKDRETGILLDLMGDRLDGRSLAFEARAGRFKPYSPNFVLEGLE